MIFNLTPHAITIAGRTIEPDGRVPRVIATTVTVGEADGLPLTETTLGEVTGLPEPQDGVWLVVSRMVAEAARDRTDLLIPNGSVRDELGRVTGAASLARLPQSPTRLVLELDERDVGQWERHGTNCLVLGYTLADIDVPLRFRLVAPAEPERAVDLRNTIGREQAARQAAA